MIKDARMVEAGLDGWSRFVQDHQPSLRSVSWYKDPHQAAVRLCVVASGVLYQRAVPDTAMHYDPREAVRRAWTYLCDQIWADSQHWMAL